MNIFVFAVLFLAQDRPLKVGIVNIRSCFDDVRCESAKELKQSLKDRKDRMVKELKDVEDKIRHCESVMRDLPPEGPLFRKYRAERGHMMATYKATEEIGKIELQEFVLETRSKFLERIGKAVREIAEERELDLVFREDSILEDQAAVLFAAKRFDITARVIAKLDGK